MRHVIDAIAAQGRNGDTELLHVTKGELAGLDAFKRSRTGTGLPRNPRTGLKEANWFNQYVAPVLPAAAGLAAGALTGGAAAVPVATAVGAATGAGIKGVQGGSTQDVLMGGVMGGIAGYGAGSLGAGLAEGAATSGASGVGSGAGTQAATLAEQNAGMGLTGAEQTGQILGTTNTGLGSQSAMLAEQNAGMGMTAAESNANIMSSIGHPVDAAGANIATPVATNPTPTNMNWDYLTSKQAAGNVAPIATGSMGMASLMPQDQTTTEVPGVNKTLPKAEVYYTPYGERRTRIAAAQGGLMGYGDYDGAEDGVGIRQYGFGGVVESIQPGGAWGNATADLYGVVDKNLPFMKDITPGGAVGQLQPGRRDWERKQAEEEQRKKAEQEAGIAAALKARQQQEFTDKWTDRYSAPVQGMAGGGITNIAAAKGRYLQGPGDGMSDSIPASIDGKQEARLATGEFVVPADVVSHLGNGDSNAGAKQLHAMMDRARQTRTGTKKQGKQINPRKVMPT